MVLGDNAVDVTTMGDKVGGICDTIFSDNGAFWFE